MINYISGDTDLFKPVGVLNIDAITLERNFV